MPRKEQHKQGEIPKLYWEDGRAGARAAREHKKLQAQTQEKEAAKFKNRSEASKRVWRKRKADAELEQTLKDDGPVEDTDGEIDQKQSLGEGSVERQDEIGNVTGVAQQAAA